MFPRPLGPEELLETPGQALCPSGLPLRSRPPRPWRPRSLGGGVPEAVGKGGLIAGGSRGVPGAGTAWCSLAHLALWSLLRPRAKASAPADPLCPQGLIHPRAKPSAIWRPPPHSGVSLHSPRCSSLQNPVLWGHLHPPGGPSALWTGPSNLQDTPLPSSSLLLPAPPLPSRGSPPPFRDPSLPSGTPSVLRGPTPGHPLAGCVLRVRIGVGQSRADGAGSLWVWRSRETFLAPGSLLGPGHGPLHPEARSTAEAPLVGWSLGHPHLRPFLETCVLNQYPTPAKSQPSPYTETTKALPVLQCFFSAFFVDVVLGFCGAWEFVVCFALFTICQ